MTDFLKIDISKSEFHFGRDRKMFTNRVEAEDYLVLEYGVTKERAKMIISQGAIGGGVYLNAIIERPRIINDGTVGDENE